MYKRGREEEGEIYSQILEHYYVIIFCYMLKEMYHLSLI